jgi:predicted dinucleotide-binding enzyme
MDEIADALTSEVVVVPSNPFSTDAHGKAARVLPDGQSSGEVVAGWLPAGTRLAMAFGSCRPTAWNPQATGYRTRLSTSKRPTTIMPARKSSG